MLYSVNGLHPSQLCPIEFREVAGKSPESETLVRRAVQCSMPVCSNPVTLPTCWTRAVLNIIPK